MNINKKMLNRNILYLMILVLFGMILCFNGQSSFAEEKRVLKVGWFEVLGDKVHGKDELGNYYGYDYDFLMAISQYTGWEYEFVEGDFFECYEWLKNGEIDIMGVVNKTPEREEDFDFAYMSSGTEFSNLYFPVDAGISFDEFNKFDNLKIGVEKGTYQTKALRQYAKDNNFEYEEVVFNNIPESAKALDNKQIDAFLASNTDSVTGYLQVAQFNAIPYYYVVKKGDKELLKELNNALNQIYKFNPNFTVEIYDKWFVRDLRIKAIFNNAEKAYIESNPDVFVLYDSIWFPIEYIDQKTGKCKGIVPDIIQKIEEISGLKLRVITQENSVEILKDLKKGTDTFITSISYDFDWAKKNNVKITQPFSNSTIVKVSKLNSQNIKRVSVVELDYITENIKKLYPDLELVYYSDISLCLDALKNGEVDCTFINNYQAEYYLKQPEYNYLAFNNVDDFNQKLCFGVAESANPLLFSIISKSLAEISRGEIQKIIYNNTKANINFSFKYFIKLHFIGTIVVLIFVGSLIVAVLLIIIRHKMRITEQMTIENERFNELSKMSNEEIFEYSYEKDKISVKNKTTEFFECDNIEKFYEYAKINKNDWIVRVRNLIEDGLDKEIKLKVSEIWYSLTIKIIKSSNNKNLYAIGKIQNIDKMMKEKEDLIDKASRDSMTNLLNFGSFNFKMHNMDKITGTLFIIDIDNFKFINDNFGHKAGDEFIIAVANVIHSVSRETDLSARIGGDEFALFIGGLLEKKDIDNIANRIIKGVRKIKIDDIDKQITVSIGAAIAHDFETYEELYKIADKAMYNVKYSTKNGYDIEMLD